MNRHFSFVIPIVAASTDTQYIAGTLGLSKDFHIKSFQAEIEGSTVSGKFAFNIRIYKTQDWFMYQALSDAVWGTSIQYLPFLLPGDIVIPKQQNLELQLNPLATFTSGQLVFHGYLQ